jgi:hypothetical protein
MDLAWLSDEPWQGMLRLFGSGYHPATLLCEDGEWMRMNLLGAAILLGYE